MITQTLTFGTFNLAAVARKGSLTVNPIPKLGAEWTDINSNRHVTIVGWTYEVEVELNPLTYTQAQNLFSQIKAQPKTLTFPYAGESSNLTQSSIVEELPLEPTFISTLCKSGATLKFVEAY